MDPFSKRPLFPNPKFGSQRHLYLQPAQDDRYPHPGKHRKFISPGQNLGAAVVVEALSVAFCGSFVASQSWANFTTRHPLEALFFLAEPLKSLEAHTCTSEPLMWGWQGSPFVPSSLFSSDLFGFALLVFRNIPICSDFRILFRFVPVHALCFSGIPRLVPIRTIFFQFVFRTSKNKSGEPLSADPTA